MKRAAIWVIIIATIAWWGWLAYRSLALASGRLGPVTVVWHPLSEQTAYAQWSPSASVYQLNSTGLTLAPGGTAQLLVDPPPRLRFFRVAVAGADGLSLDDENRNPSQRSNQPANIRLYDRQAIIPITGRYRITIRNTSSAPAVVQKLVFTWQP